MLTFLGPQRQHRPGVSRRDVLRVGGLAFACLTLADVLRLQAEAAASPASDDDASNANPTGDRRGKSVIMVWLRGGPSHVDSYDMKPDQPPEIRGEFQPTATNVPGIHICDLMPRQAQLMDKLAIVRGIKSVDIGDHTPHYILTGFPDRGKRPVFGSIVSRLQPRPGGLPTYASLMYEPPRLYDNEGPTYVGSTHRPFAPRDEGLDNLSIACGISLERLSDRKQLLREFDSLNRRLNSAIRSPLDVYTERALAMVASPQAREAFNLKLEPPGTRERYGKYCESLLMARRLVEAGVAVVTLKLGDWDTHEHNFRDMRDQLPQLDQGIHALVTDLYDRGLERDVAVVVWGEFGRDPRISRIAGRDHWPEAGAALMFGGGFKVGQTIGETDSRGARATTKPYSPSNVLATLYHHLGIDPAQTLPDFNNRPMHLLDDREVIRELI